MKKKIKNIISIISLPIYYFIKYMRKLYLITSNYVLANSFGDCGENFYIMDNSFFIRGAKNIVVKNNVKIFRNVRIEAITNFNNQVFNPKIVIKDNVTLNDFVHIAATNYVEIGNNVLIASRVFITDHNHGIYKGNDQTKPTCKQNHKLLTKTEKVIIGDNVWIGEGACILPGVQIGENAIIGANTVVTKNIPENSIVAGNPAKILKMYNNNKNIWEDV